MNELFRRIDEEIMSIRKSEFDITPQDLLDIDEILNVKMPYTYIIGWKKLKKWYYGVRYSKTIEDTRSDLWSKYFTSSAPVKTCRNEHGEPDVIKVVKVFQSKDDAIAEEIRFLTKIKNTKNWNDNWLNIVARTPTCGKMRYISDGESTIYTSSPLLDGWYEVERSLHVEYEGKTGPKRGYVKMYNPVTSKVKMAPPDKVDELAAAGFIRGMRPDLKEKVSKAHKEESLIVLICPHCGKTGTSRMFKRWHFNNCKLNTVNLAYTSSVKEKNKSPEEIVKFRLETEYPRLKLNLRVASKETISEINKMLISGENPSNYPYFANKWRLSRKRTK